MSDAESPNPSDPLRESGDDSLLFAARLHAEIVADAERRRREDPQLARIEREFERAWAHVAPPGAAGSQEELLLDRVDRLSLVDVDVPIGSKPGIRHVKGVIRKATYWYLRYMSDQLNALHNVQARLLRRMDDRLRRIEAAVGLDQPVAELVAPAPAPSGLVGALLAELIEPNSLESRPVVVGSCGSGAAVGALEASGHRVFGVDADSVAVLAGIDEGLDLRVADPEALISGAEAGSIGALLIGGELQRRTVSGVIQLANAATAAVGPAGVVVVVPESLAGRDAVDAELLVGRSVSAGVWARVLEAADASTEVRVVDGIDVVVARVT